MKSRLIKIFSFCLAAIFATSVFADAKVKDVGLEVDANGVKKAVLLFDGMINAKVEAFVKNNILQLSLPKVVAWPKIEKKVTLDKEFDTTLMAYQFDNSVVRFRVILPYETNVTANDLSYEIKNNKLLLQLPDISTKVAKTAIPVKIEKANIETYDEKYLEKLLLDVKDSGGSKKMDVTSKKSGDLFKRDGLLKEDKKISDQVNLSASALEKEIKGENNFSFATYVAKFVAFLGLTLLLFYGVVNLFRKGVLKKGKLAFLNKEEVVSVISTTYIAPKKSLVLVKVAGQVLLLGSDEKGINLLTEVKNVNGLLKESEQKIAGSNFDNNLDDADLREQNFNLKEVDLEDGYDWPEDRSVVQNSKKSSIKDEVRFSDQIKNKVKGLKPLQ